MLVCSICNTAEIYAHAAEPSRERCKLHNYVASIARNMLCKVAEPASVTRPQISPVAKKQESAACCGLFTQQDRVAHLNNRPTTPPITATTSEDRFQLLACMSMLLNYAGLVSDPGMMTHRYSQIAICVLLMI